jgi:hypothetical protein
MIKFLMKHQGRTFSPNYRGFTEGVGSTMGLLLCRLKNISSTFFSLSAVVPAEEYLISFLFLTSTSVFQSGCGYGLTVQ